MSFSRLIFYKQFLHWVSTHAFCSQLIKSNLNGTSARDHNFFKNWLSESSDMTTLDNKSLQNRK